MFSFTCVWQKVGAQLRAEIMNFWEAHEALPLLADPEERAEETVFIARTTGGEIAALCTARELYLKRFQNSFYFYRSMTSIVYRRKGLALDLLLRTRSFFERRFTAGEGRGPIGLLIILENPSIAKRFRVAMETRTGFVFMGYNTKGHPIGVYYFKGATI
ncbi:MAG: hypothetical protein K9N21_14540 [Deltaproteobacteria bacterium]|nr:hypothetical protein [Deltaproteobacteria bacterium]